MNEVFENDEEVSDVADDDIGGLYAGIVLRCNRVQEYAVRATAKRVSRPQGVSNWSDHMQD